MEDNLEKLNVYDLLGVKCTADLKEIKKAYRKKALSCHPDKNPDDPNAAKLFHQLSRVLELLLDSSARAAYDKVLEAREAAKLRNQHLDSARKRFKLQLEEQELKAEENRNKFSDEEKLRLEIERLRQQSSVELEEERKRVQEILKEQLNEKMCSLCRLQIRWKSKKNDPDNGGYNLEILKNIFAKYGKIEALVVSNRKKGSALVELSCPEAAKEAKYFENGLESNPFQLSFIGLPEVYDPKTKS